MVEVTVAHLGLDRTTSSPVVILKEKDGGGVLPIWIGPAEANAIAMEMQGVKPPRPMTHDLLKQVLVGLGATLRRVTISQVKERTYFAELLVQQGEKVYQFDARPSDSIALALRVQAPIFTDPSMLDRTVTSPGDSSPSSTLDAERLRQHLEKMDPQDFGRFTP